MKELPVKRLQLKRNWFLLWNGTIYKIHELLDNNEVVLMDDRTKELRTVSVLDIHQARDDEIEQGGAAFSAPTKEALIAAFITPVEIPEAVSSVQLPEVLLKRAERIVKTVELVAENVKSHEERAFVQRNNTHLRQTAILLAALDALPPELRVEKSQYYEYRKVYLSQSGNIERIAESLRRSTFNKTKVPTPALHLIDTIILLYYGRNKSVSVRETYDELIEAHQRTKGFWINPDDLNSTGHLEIVAELIDEKIPFENIENYPEKFGRLVKVDLPSRSWFYDYIRWFMASPKKGGALYKEKYGTKAYDEAFLVFDTFANTATAPLQHVFSDHKLLPLYVVDEQEGQTYRLWFTALIDAFTRAILGFALLKEDPCIESIQTALLHAIWPKDLSDFEDIGANWVVYGIPQRLYLDNAWAHRSHSVEALGREISLKGNYSSIEIVLRPPYKARYGALIESLFGNSIDQLKSRVPGTIHTKGDPKSNDMAKREAILQFGDIYHFLTGMIVRYMHTPHSGLDYMTPHEKWSEWIETFGHPPVPQLTDRVRRLFWRQHYDTRTLTPKGISLFTFHYLSPRHSSSDRIDARTGKPVEYSIRYDINDVHRIALYRDGIYLFDAFAKELRQPDGTYRNVSMAELDRAKWIMKRFRMPRGELLNVLNGIYDLDSLDEIVQQRKAEKRKGGKGSKPRSVRQKPSKADVAATDSALTTRQDDHSGSEFESLLMNFAKTKKR